MLKTTDFIVRDLGSHIRYIDGAQTQKLPWSFIRPIERMVKDFLPETEIMLRPQWKYNYTIMTTNLYDVYHYYLSRYFNYVDGKNPEEILVPLGKSFYIISFPFIERNNILLHCLIGHEIGHLVLKKYFTEKRSQELLQSIRDRVAAIVQKNIEKSIKDIIPDIPPPPLFVHSLTQQMIQAQIKRTMEIWQRGLEEILSDIIGSFLFGPAILFSTLEIALQDLDGLDKVPNENNNYYPPWRMRLRNIFEVVKDLKLLPLPHDKFIEKKIVNSVGKRFTLIEEIVGGKSDKEGIENEEILKIAYEEIEKDIPQAKTFYTNELEKLIVKSNDFYDHLPPLIERIDFGIPPNACEKSIHNRKLSTIVEIINSAWFHKLAWDDNLFDPQGAFNNKVLEKRSRMNRLTLKALEYSDIEIDYINK